MKCHVCHEKMSRFMLKKHICKNQFRSVGISDKWRAYLKKFGSRPTQLAPDSLKAGASCLPDTVKVENALPAVSG